MDTVCILIDDMVMASSLKYLYLLSGASPELDSKTSIHYIPAFLFSSDRPPWLAAAALLSRCNQLLLSAQLSPPWPRLGLFAETMSKRGKQNFTQN